MASLANQQLASFELLKIYSHVEVLVPTAPLRAAAVSCQPTMSIDVLQTNLYWLLIETSTVLRLEKGMQNF